MILRSHVGAVYGELLSCAFRRSARLGDHGPIVSFSFDDFPRSAYVVGGDLLKRFGGRGTYYVAMDLMGSRNNLGEQFHQRDLCSLVEDGHELASHTKSHLSSREVSFEQFRENVQEGREAIANATGMSDSGNFAYPYGHVTFGAKRKLGPELASCRGTRGGTNGPDLDLNLLRANRLYGDLDQAGPARELILRNKRQKSWLIFYTHDVDQRPSQFGCTPALLEAALSYAVDEGARVMTIAAVLAEIGIQIPQLTPST
jgi:peptidoglycan/xylan/chitin deacetylase (PgdA/CDA1 family)